MKPLNTAWRGENGGLNGSIPYETTAHARIRPGYANQIVFITRCKARSSGATFFQLESTDGATIVVSGEAAHELCRVLEALNR